MVRLVKHVQLSQDHNKAPLFAYLINVMTDRSLLSKEDARLVQNIQDHQWKSVTNNQAQPMMNT
jgi:hypothetical protein